MKRRKFLELSAGSFIAAPFILNHSFSVYTGSSASAVISVTDHLAQSLKYAAGKSPNADGVIVDKILSYSLNYNRVAAMVDSAVKNLTGKSTVGKAWESLFPAGHPTLKTTIGMKVNFSYGWEDNENDWSKTICPFGPKGAVTDAIVSGLTQMFDGTFPAENILIYDLGHTVIRGSNNPVLQGLRQVNPDAGGFYKDKQAGTYRLHWVNTKNVMEIPANAPEFVAAPEFPEPYNAPQRIIPPVYENDFMINLAVAKDHREAGVTGVMKNTFGCTDNCANTHGDKWMNMDSPYAGSSLTVPVFYKTMDRYSPCILNILDALAGIYHGGPGSGRVFQADTVAVSRDPVAIDMYLLRLINDARRKNNYSVLSTADGKASDGHPNAPVLRIAEEQHELGSMSLENIRQIELSGDSGRIDIPSFQNKHSRLSEVCKGGQGYCIGVTLDKSGRNHKIDSQIRDLSGRTIRTFNTLSTSTSQALLEWDLQNNHLSSVKEGIYIWNVSVDGLTHTRTIIAG